MVHHDKESRYFLIIYVILALMLTVRCYASTFIQGPALIEQPTSTTTAATTTTLTSASETNQMFTGSTTQTVVLPDATTLPVGRRFYITNRSTGIVTVNLNGGTLARTLGADSQATFILKNNGATAGTWDISTTGLALGTFGSSPNSSGASISGSTLTLQPADATNPGGLSILAQDLTGIKTFASAPLITPLAAVSATTNGIVYAGTGGALTVDPNNLVWDSTNKRFGIGQGGITPLALLDVHQPNSTIPALQANNTGTQSVSGGGVIQIIADPGAAITSGSRLGILQFAGATDASSTFRWSAGINSLATENWSGTAAGAQLNFYTTANTTQTRSVVLTLDQDKSATFAGTISGTQLTSTVSTGTAPLVVASTTQVANLNAATAGSAGTLTGNLTGDVTSVGMATTYAGTVPLNKGGTGQTTKAPAFDALSPMTTAGDVIYGGASGTGTRLAAGTATQVFHGGTTPSWSAVSLTADVSGVTPIANGGTNNGSLAVTAGGVLYTDGSKVVNAGAGTSSQVLKGGTTPSWGAPTYTAPLVTKYTSGSSNHTVTGSPLYLIARFVGAGGGGCGVTVGSAYFTGSTGGDTSFNSVVAKGGTGGAQSTGGTGGTGGTGTATLRIPGSHGGTGTSTANDIAGAIGGSAPFFNGAGYGGNVPAGGGGNAAANSGSGGGGTGGSAGSGVGSTGAGGSGEYVEVQINSPSGSYAYVVGASGAGGAGTTPGGNGGAGFIEVTEYYQ